MPLRRFNVLSLGPFDIGGELFQKAISDRDDAASYYTKPAVADLLARLVFHKLPSVNLKADYYSKYKSLRIGDFACGTGTLLRAVQRQLFALAKQSEFDQKETEKLHHYLMEAGFLGVDISPIAAHLTASSLSNYLAQVKYKTTNIGVIGVGGNEGSTGSIEFLESGRHQDLFEGKLTQGSLSSESVGSDLGKLTAPVESFDVIVMNPPYQRARGQQKQFDVAGITEGSRKKALERCQKICRRYPAINLKAGLGSVFASSRSAV